MCIRPDKTINCLHLLLSKDYYMDGSVLRILNGVLSKWKFNHAIRRSNRSLQVDWTTKHEVWELNGTKNAWNYITNNFIFSPTLVTPESVASHNRYCWVPTCDTISDDTLSDDTIILVMIQTIPYHTIHVTVR